MKAVCLLAFLFIETCVFCTARLVMITIVLFWTYSVSYFQFCFFRGSDINFFKMSLLSLSEWRVLYFELLLLNLSIRYKRAYFFSPLGLLLCSTGFNLLHFLLQSSLRVSVCTNISQFSQVLFTAALLFIVQFLFCFVDWIYKAVFSFSVLNNRP